MDTIFALSSGALPAAIAVVRISGGQAREIGRTLLGSMPEPRRASVRQVTGPDGTVLDHALVLWFPGPDSSTGEDCLELHCHGGRAVVARIEAELGRFDRVRPARPGEFTQRAFANNRLDLTQVEALGDLLSAETELQRSVAQAAFAADTERPATRWRREVLRLSALVESAIDFEEEGDVDGSLGEVREGMAQLRREMAEYLARPTNTRLREGVCVALAGPPNSGKSSLFNALLRDAVAITSPVAGTTRDVLERPVAIEGVPLVLTDTAGLRADSADLVEQEGIARAHRIAAEADIVLWLGPEGEGPASALEIQAKSDAPDIVKRAPRHRVSATTGEGIAELERDLAERARTLLPKPGTNALNERQHDLARRAADALRNGERDWLVLAEQLRYVRSIFDNILGHTATEDMLDALFSSFCIGK